MRKTDRLRYEDLGRQLREIRLGEHLTTRALARRTGLGQPWISEIERAVRLPDVFDFVRLMRGLGVRRSDAMTLLETIIDDDGLDMPKAKAPKVRPYRRRRG